MRSEPRVRLSEIVKDYALGEPRSAWRRLLAATAANPPSPGDAFRAVDGVSLEVFPGETLAIVGRNGSGKSTLLQILCGVLDPTSGTRAVSGRLATMLELGSGFHPDFTGRENAMLLGALLGVPGHEMRGRLAEVAAFAEIGRFLDQPLRHYSSGMVLRLAFAVHTVVPSEILVIDETLAVGDDGFQRKCFAWLEQHRAEGGILVFVSHAMQTVVRIATRAVLLEAGKILVAGDPKTVSDAYHRLLYGGRLDRPEADSAPALAEEEAQVALPPEREYGNGDASILRLELVDAGGQPIRLAASGDRCSWRYEVEFSRDSFDVSYGMMVKTVDGVEVAGMNSRSHGEPLREVSAGARHAVSFSLTMNLAPGFYLLNAGVDARVDGEPTYLHRRVDAWALRIVPPVGASVQHGLAHLAAELSTEVIA